MARKNTIRLLLINGSDNDSEHLVSLFRAAGRVARAQRVERAVDLAETLQQEWDLLIVDDRHPELQLESTLETLRAQKIDLPVIALRETADSTALFAAGAQDVIAPTDEQRIVGAALRELANGELRRTAARLRRQLEEAEQRSALLLGEADQAIAYVADGMVIGANPVFAERFGHASVDDLDCMPVMDLITANDHEGFKAALKNGLEGRFVITGTRTDGETFEATLRLLSATYDDDPCTQLIIDSQAADAPLPSAIHDAETGLYTRNYLLEQLAHRKAGRLLYLGIDRYAELRRELGFNAALRFSHGVARLLKSANPDPQITLARLNDDSFALLADSLDDKSALDLGWRLHEALAAQDFGSNGSVERCLLRIGIAAIGRGMPLETLDHAFEAAVGTDDERGGVAIYREAGAAAPLAAPIDPEQMLDDALAEQRFAILFQPIISLRGASGEHYEVLLRMRGDTDALELPDNFIDALGRSATNARLDRWILLEATKQLAENRGRGNDTRLLINLTANVLHDETLLSWLGVALKAAALPSSALILQLREIDVINDMPAAKTFAEGIRQLGCRFSIGGFGRVMDSLKTLKSVPVDLVQVDASFTRNLLANNDTQPLKNLVAGVGAESAAVVIPFVENASVLATLWQVGADFIQGHYLQAPGRSMNYEFTDIA
jgi:EAL domain-containing protein (putative c-di-GMP-specific phosphodiesterase class I)/GGDEF domain-containing protein/DNA-binding NarL/FixJ family response regulator